MNLKIEKSKSVSYNQQYFNDIFLRTLSSFEKKD